MRSILYITYDGLTDPLGQSQILAYLKRLSRNNRIVILSFEKEALYRKDSDQIKTIADANGLTWIHLTYTKRPPLLSTVYDIIKGFRICKKLHRQYNFQIVHCRGYIPAILGRKLQKAFGLKFIFDMRGWWADEKLESGFWDNKIYQPVYRYFKFLEKQFFFYCDYAVSLTHKGKDEIEKQYQINPGKIGVIPTCVDFDIFQKNDEQTKTGLKQKLGILPSEKVFVYSGSVGGNYDPRILISVFKSFQQMHPESYLLILTKDQFTEDLHQLFKKAGVERMAIYNAPFAEVTHYLRAADVGFIYYKMSFSTIGRSPTKMGEYWASGVPVIAFKGIGDLDHILTQYPGSGVLLSPDDMNTISEIQQLQFADSSTLRQYALDYFHVDKGVIFYQAVYEQLAPSKKIMSIATLPISFNRVYTSLKSKYREIYSFQISDENIDQKTVDSFGDEWQAFHGFDEKEIQKLGDEYFDIITPQMLNKTTSVLEVGSGSGRFLKYLSDKAGFIVGVDPSHAIYAADNLLGKKDNVVLVKASANDLPFADGSFDFVYSIGVLHHIPDTQKAMQDCVDKVKKGGYFFTYLYYNLDNRGFLFRSIFNVSTLLRRGVSQLPSKPKKLVCDLLAIGLYMPFVGFSRLLKRAGVKEAIRRKIPLYGYENKSFYIIRNDALDRFGTPLEQRFTKREIQEMMEKCGLDQIVFSNNIPYWHAVGKKR